MHLLMARGAQEFETLFPGLLDDMVAAGVPMLENRPDCIHFGAAGHVLGTGHTLRDEFTAYVPSRPHLEWQIRRRRPRIDNVDDRPAPRCRSHGSTRAAGDRRAAGSDERRPKFVPADLVVDAAGRGTRLPVWLAQWGYQRPVEETVDVGISYATHQFRIPDGLIAEKVVVAGASHDEPLGLGMLYYEDGTWVLTTFGVAKVEPPRTFPGCLRWPTKCFRRTSTPRWPTAEPDRRTGVPHIPDQQVAPLRQAGALPGRDRPVRRRGGQLQPHLRAGHDDDVAAGRSSATGAGIPRRSSWPPNSTAPPPRRPIRCGR